MTWINETPDLLTLTVDEASGKANYFPNGQPGQAFVRADYGEDSARVQINIVPPEYQINLSTGAIVTTLNRQRQIQLMTFSSSLFHEKDFTVEWIVDKPDILSVTEVEGTNSRQVSVSALKPGVAVLTCRATLADGTTAEDYCTVIAYDDTPQSTSDPEKPPLET